MKPIIQKLGMIVAALLSFLTASAYDFEVDGIYYNITDPTAKTVEVTYKEQYKSNYSGHIDLPASVTYNGEEYSVISIGDEAFYWCILSSINISYSVTSIGDKAFYSSRLSYIFIPESVSSIGDMAFTGCSDLREINVDADNQMYSSYDGVLYNKPGTSLIFYPPGFCGSVRFPQTVITIGDHAFANCSSLTSITLPNSVTTIGDSAFADCNNLISITLPNSVTTIGDKAFADCNSLTSITMPNSVTSIGRYAFDNCNSLTSITIPIASTMATIGEGAFYRCSSLTSIDIPNSVTIIGDVAFEQCSSLTSVTIPNSVISIGSWAFSECSSLTSITIPNSVTYIGGHTFSNCSNLASVSISNSVTTLWGGDFRGCSSLTSIIIPSSVTVIWNWEFSGCNSLTSITSLAVTPPECSSYTFYDLNEQECTLYVLAGSKKAYQQAWGWKGFSKIEEINLVSEIKLSETEVTVREGANFQLTAEILPADAAIKDLLWKSSDESCVSVDESGLLTAISQGSATITVRSVDGNAEATCFVKVVPTTGIESVEASADGAVEVFNLTGVKVADSTENLPAGIYLVRKGSTVRKVVVK